MVKADLSRDYYGDLEIAPTADLLEIKKQFKKLALAYHPDRNPGRESEVTARFQKIQSAHEVLIDAHERAKYDANRVRPTARYQSGGNQRGNPWSNAGSQFPPPPKPPTARNRAPGPPPPSAGAQRYKNFETPKQSANHSAQEGAEARRSTYQAWENMRNGSAKNGPGQSWNRPGAVPKGTPQSGREESNSYKHRPPPAASAGFDEYRPSPATSPHRQAQSSSAQNRKGFMPNTPGGDEPAAPRGAYFTERNKSAQAPEPPPRQYIPDDMPGPHYYPKPPQRTSQAFEPQSPTADPLRRSRQKAEAPYEPRISTPYATHGGEKLNPFDASNMNRSKSTREARDRTSGSKNMPRAGSDSNLSSPQRGQSFAQSSRQGRRAYAVPLESDSSSDSGPTIKTRPRPGQPYENRTFAKPRSSMKSPAQGNGTFSPNPEQGSMGGDSNGQSSRRASNGVGAGQSNAQTNTENPSMYGARPILSGLFSNRPNLQAHTYGIRLPTVSESPSNDPFYDNDAANHIFSREQFSSKYPNLFPEPNTKLATPPSGVSGRNLFPLEEEQRSVLDGLINRRNQEGTFSSSVKERPFTTYPRSFTVPSLSSHEKHVSEPMAFRDSAEVHAKKQRHRSSEVHSEAPTSFGVKAARPRFWVRMENANRFASSSFNFHVDDAAFQRTKQNSFSGSAENISTKFTPEEWEGKFEAGYFQPEQKAANVSHNTRARAQSGDRSRGRPRSPTKNRPVDPHHPQLAHSDSEIPMAQSPGGTKFSQEEWAGTFKPQTFMPPPPPPATKTTGRPAARKRGSVVKPTMGTAAVIDSDSDSTPEKPLFTGRAPQSNPQAMPSPDPMDVDSPPIFKPSTPIPTARGTIPTGLHTTTSASPPKRPAAPSSPTDQEAAAAAALKVTFADLHIPDLLTTLSIPSPPSPPPTLPVPHTQAQYDAYLAMFAAYMRDWDLFANRIMLHLVARKNQVDSAKERRWMDDTGLEQYRRGVREDGVVMGVWRDAIAGHERVLVGHAVVRERIRGEDEERPRKKVS